MSNAIFPAAKKIACASMLSPKTAALSHDAADPTALIASAPAPNDSGVRESEISPVTNPMSAAKPGRTCTAARSTAMTRKSTETRDPSSGRTV